jgi:predicted metal-dependent hydrolase
MEIDQIIRTKRKSIALIIKPDGSLVIRAPLKATKAQILALIEKQAEWICTRQEAARAAYARTRPVEFVDGEGFLFLGKVYPLQVVERAGKALVFKDGFFLDKGSRVKARDLFTAWYRKQARRVFEEKVARAAARYTFAYKRVKITSAEKRWGSCNSLGTLSFPWRLVMAPEEVIDYVVVHELVHTVIRNHGKEFWGRVREIVPDFKARRGWLEENAYRMRLE